MGYPYIVFPDIHGWLIGWIRSNTKVSLCGAILKSFFLVFETTLNKQNDKDNFVVPLTSIFIVTASGLTHFV